MTTNDYKQCTKCGEWKPRTEFHVNRIKPDGLHPNCKACRSLTNNPRRAESDRRYKAERADEYRAQARRWAAENPDQHRESGRQWREKNRVKRVLYDIRRRMRRYMNGGDYTAEEWEALCAYYGHKCLACGSSGPLVVDHVVPVSKGGSNDIYNLQPLCRSCNAKKHDKIIDYRY